MKTEDEKVREGAERVRAASAWYDGNPGGLAVTIRANDRDTLLSALANPQREGQ